MKTEAAVLWGLHQKWEVEEVELDEPITREYTLEEINQGYDDMHAGINLRGLIRF